MATGRFSKRNSEKRSYFPDHNAHVVAWLHSEERAYACGYIAVINGQVVRKGGFA